MKDIHPHTLNLYTNKASSPCGTNYSKDPAAVNLLIEVTIAIPTTMTRPVTGLLAAEDPGLQSYRNPHLMTPTRMLLPVSVAVPMGGIG